MEIEYEHARKIFSQRIIPVEDLIVSTCQKFGLHDREIMELLAQAAKEKGKPIIAEFWKKQAVSGASVAEHFKESPITQYPRPASVDEAILSRAIETIEELDRHGGLNLSPSKKAKGSAMAYKILSASGNTNESRREIFKLISELVAA